jgi:DNA-binding PadR family transcriptional regulator
LTRLEKAGAVVATESQALRDGDAPVTAPPTGSLSGELAVMRARRHSPARSRRGKKVYRITEKGRVVFTELLTEGGSLDDARSFGLRLAFARHLAPQARLALLERRKAQLTRRLDADRTRAAGHSLDDYARSLVEHGTEATEHDIAWLDRLIEAERQKQTATRTETRLPRDGDAVATTKGINR